MDIISDGPRLVLAGEFDVRSTFQVRQAVYQHLHTHDDDVVIDMTDVSSIDLTALKVLAVATRYAERTGHHLILRGCGPAVRRMLHKSHLIRLVDVERTPATA